MERDARESVSAERGAPASWPAEEERTWFEELFHRSADAIFIHDAETGKILDVNQTALPMFGMTRDDILARGLDEISLGESPYTVREARDRMARAVAEGTQRFEWLSRRKSGELFWTEVVLRSTTVGGRRLVLAQVRDITRYKTAEEDLAQVQNLLHAAIEQSPVGVAIADAPDAKLRLVNGAGLRIRGETSEALTGIPAGLQPERWQLFHPDGTAMRAEELPLTQAVLEGRTRQNVEMVIRRADGENRHVLVNSAPVRDFRGQVVAGVAYFTDFTEHRRAQLELDRFFDLSLDLLSLSSFDGYLYRVNRAWEKALGWSREELLQKPWLHFVHPDDRQATIAARARLLEGHPLVNFVNRYRCRDGSYRWLSWTTFPFPDDKLMFNVTRDVTEWRQLQERIQHTEKMEAIGQLAGGIAHDFNNQLSAMMGYADLLVRRLEDPCLNRYAQGILGAARRAADLTCALLAFARRGKFQTMPVDVHALIADVITFLERSIDKRISVRQALRAVPHGVIGDPTQLQNALLNLGLNARDAMPEGGRLTFRTDVVTLEGSHRGIRFPDLAPGLYVRIRVSDTGIGMSDEVKKRIFEPFFTTKKGGRGTGMGLPSVYGTVRSHEGAVQVASRQGRGTTMSVYLPLAASVGQPVASTQEPEPRRQARILVVDDEEGVRDALAEALQAAGHAVTTCQDGADALERYREGGNEIDVVILDMVMPRMSGPDTFAALREINPEVKVFLASGYSVEGAAQELLDRGAVGFIQKPFQARELLQKLARVW